MNEIKDKIKERHITLIQKDPTKMMLSSLVDFSASHKNITSAFNKMFYKKKEILKKTIFSFEDEKLPQTPQMKKIQSSPNLNDQKTNLMEKFKKFKEKQMENLETLKKSQKKVQMELSSKITKSMRDHIIREQQIEEEKKIQAKEKEEKYQKKYEEIRKRKQKQEENMEPEIIAKLEKFNQKIQKSKELHRKKIKEKIDKTLKLRETSEIVLKNLEERKKVNEVEILKKIIENQESVKSARDRIDERIQNLALSKKELFEKRRATALQKIKRAESDFFLKTKYAERKFLDSQQAISLRKEKMQHDMLIKQELKRLKDYEGLIKVQRAKRIFVNYK